MGNMVVVNGPIRREIGMNSGLGALGPYNHANATIGRAYGLLSQNLQGGSVPGETYMGSQGNNLSYNSVTFAENEESSPWEPYHVQHGFEPGESTVTVFVRLGQRLDRGPSRDWEDKLMAMLRARSRISGSTLVLDPIVAREFVELGFDTKQKIVDWIHENAKMPRRRYWDHACSTSSTRRSSGIEPFAGYWAGGPGGADPGFRDEPDQHRRRRRRDERALQHLPGLADAGEVPDEPGPERDRLDRRLALDG